MKRMFNSPKVMFAAFLVGGVVTNTALHNLATAPKPTTTHTAQVSQKPSVETAPHQPAPQPEPTLNPVPYDAPTLTGDDTSYAPVEISSVQTHNYWQYKLQVLFIKF